MSFKSLGAGGIDILTDLFYWTIHIWNQIKFSFDIWNRNVNFHTNITIWTTASKGIFLMTNQNNDPNPLFFIKELRIRGVYVFISGLVKFRIARQWLETGLSTPYL